MSKLISILILSFITSNLCEVIDRCKFLERITKDDVSTYSGTQNYEEGDIFYRNITVPIDLSEMFPDTEISYRCCDNNICLYMGKCDFNSMETKCSCSYKSKETSKKLIVGQSVIQFKPPVECNKVNIANSFFNFVHTSKEYKDNFYNYKVGNEF